MSCNTCRDLIRIPGGIAILYTSLILYGASMFSCLTSIGLWHTTVVVGMKYLITFDDYKNEILRIVPEQLYHSLNRSCSSLAWSW